MTKKKVKKQDWEIIDTPYGQWEYPGAITRIPSNDITMQGVPYPVLGVSDTNDIQMMYPNQDYQFDGSSVTEYPMMQTGGRAPIYVDNPNDPRLRTYNDSLLVSQIGDRARKYIKQFPGEDQWVGDYLPGWEDRNADISKAWNRLGKVNKTFPKPSNITSIYTDSHIYDYKKPVQPVLYRPNEKIELNSMEGNLQSQPIDLGNINPLPFEPGSYFTRERKPQEADRGKMEYFDKKTGRSIGLYANGGRIPKAQIGTLTPGSSIGINMPTDLKPLTGLDLAFSKQERIPIQGNEELYNTVINNPKRYNFRIVDGRFFNYLPKEQNPIQIESKKADLLQSQSTTPRKLEFTRERQPGERFSALYTPQGQKYSAIDVNDKSGKLIRTVDPKTGKIAFKHPVTGEEQFEYGGELPEAGSGYKVVRSSERKGKTHKVTGPDGTVKFFGDSKLGQHPKDPARKKAFYARHKKNLAGNPYFRAFARKTWEEGGELTENDILDTAQNGKRLSFEEYYKTIPSFKNDTSNYDLRHGYDIIPQEQLDAFAKDSFAHLYSAYPNKKTGNWDFLKSKDHHTLQHELDWYNSNTPESNDFRNKYNLDKSGEYYKYTPKKLYTQKAPLPGQSVPTMDFAQGGKIKVKSQDWEILDTAQDGRSLTSSELASRFRPEDAYQRSPIKFENIGNKSYGFGIRPNNFNISGVLDLQNKENPTFRTALGYNKNGLNINIAPSFSKDKKEAIFTAGYDGRDWSGNLMYQDPSKFNLGFGYNKAGFSGNANYERQGKNNVFNTSIGYEGEDVPINAGLDYTYDNGHYASANLGFNAKNIRGGFNYDYDQSEKANRFGLNLGTNFGKNKKWAFDTSANFDTDKNYKINTGLKYNFKSGGMLPDLNAMAFGGNLILEKYQDGGSNWEILPEAQGGKQMGIISDPRKDAYYTQPANNNQNIQQEILKQKSANYKGSESNPIQKPEVEIVAKKQLDPSKKAFGTVYPDKTGSSAKLASALFLAPIGEWAQTPSTVVNYGIGAYKNKDLTFNPYQSEITETLDLKTDPNDLWHSVRNFAINNAADFLVPVEGIAQPGAKFLTNLEKGVAEGAGELANPVSGFRGVKPKFALQNADPIITNQTKGFNVEYDGLLDFQKKADFEPYKFDNKNWYDVPEQSQIDLDKISKLKSIKPSEYFDRRQFVKKLIEKGIVSKKTDIQKYARSLEDTEDLTKRAIEQANTYYRGVTPKIPTKTDIGLGGRDIDQNKVIKAMQDAGVDLSNEEEIGKYMASHVPLYQFGYRSGVGDARGLDALYTSKGHSSYGDMTFELKKPFNFSEGSYKDWLNTYETPSPIYEDIQKIRELEWKKNFPEKKGSYYMSNENFNAEYPKWMIPYKYGDHIFMGKKGERIFDNVKKVEGEIGRTKSKDLPYKNGGKVKLKPKSSNWEIVSNNEWEIIK